MLNVVSVLSHVLHCSFLTQIVSSAKDVVTTATGAVTERVSGAKDSMSGTLSSVRGAVYDGMDKTCAAVSGSVSTVLVNTVARIVSISVGSALSTSESLVEQYLPLTEDELGEGTNNDTYTLNTGIPFVF